MWVVLPEPGFSFAAGRPRSDEQGPRGEGRVVGSVACVLLVCADLRSRDGITHGGNLRLSVKNQVVIVGAF